MALGDPSDHGRFLTYSLNLNCAVALLHDFAATGDLPPQPRIHKLEFAREHLGRFARAEALLAAAAGPIVPDLESLQIYRSVLEALAAAKYPSLDRAHPGIAVDALISTLSQVLNGVTPEKIGVDPLQDLEKTLNALASLYAERAGAHNWSLS